MKIPNSLKYIDAFEGSVFAAMLFAIATVVIPGQGPSEDVKIILTVSTFLFAILAGFFIARQSKRYDRLRELVATQDANWVSLYKAAQIMGSDFAKRIADRIDMYYIVWFDFSIGQSAYKHTSKYLDDVYDELRDHAELAGDNTDSLYDELVLFLSDIEKNRNRESVLSLERMTIGQWGAMVILAGIIVFSLYHLMVPFLYSKVITTLLSTVLVLVLLMLRDLQNLMHGGEMQLDESGEEVLEIIGKPRYYNKKYLDSGITVIPDTVQEYRLGLHNPGEEFQIELHRRGEE